MDTLAFLEKAEHFDPTDRAGFAELVAAGRALSGRTLYDIAQECHTGAGTVSRWENGHAAPPPIARVAIVKKLKAHVKRVKEAAEASSSQQPAVGIVQQAAPRSRRQSGEIAVQMQGPKK